MSVNDAINVGLISHSIINRAIGMSAEAISVHFIYHVDISVPIHQEVSPSID